MLPQKKQVKSKSAACTITAVNGKATIGFVQVTANKEMKYAARKQFAEEVLYYVNIERKKEGLAPLHLMYDLSYLAHIRTDGIHWSTDLNTLQSLM